MKEINGGDWEGVKFADLPVRFPQSHHDWENAPHLVQMPNGESMVEFQQRLVGEVTRIIGHHPGKNICIVTHGTAIKALMCHFKGISLEGMHNIPWFDNTSITTVDYEEGNFTILSQGEDSHLGMELSTIRNQDWWEDYIKKLNERNSINGTDMVNEVNSTVESNVSQAGEAGDEHIPGDAEIPGEDRNGGISDG